MNKTLYIRDEDAPLWDRARELSNDKLSPVIVAAVRQFVAEKEAKAKGFERIEVSFNDSDAHGIPKTKAFYGKWIIGPYLPHKLTNEDGTIAYCYAVAVTAKGAAVVYSWREQEDTQQLYRFRVYPSLEDAAADGDVNPAVRKAIKEIGVPVEELDI